MIINQTTTLIFEYPQDYLQEQEWCKTKEDRWIHKGTDTLGAVYENQISYSIGATSDRKTENSSEKPNNCEHITEDGVTCAKYPACDDCLDNPLNKVKGSERLVKGTEQTEPQYSEDDMYWLSLVEDVANGKMSDAGANQAWLEYINHKDEPTISKMEQVETDINVGRKDEPQWTKENCKGCKYNEYPYDSGTCFVRVCINGNKYEPKDEPQAGGNE